MKPSEGPARVGIFEAATAVEKVTEMLGYGTGDIWVVWLPEHPKTIGGPPAPEHAVVAAVTGNGPTSEANAGFIAECFTRRDEILKYLEALDEADRRLIEWRMAPGDEILQEERYLPFKFRPACQPLGHHKMGECTDCDFDHELMREEVNVVLKEIQQEYSKQDFEDESARVLWFLQALSQRRKALNEGKS